MKPREEDFILPYAATREQLWSQWGAEKTIAVPMSVLGHMLNAARCYAQHDELHGSGQGSAEGRRRTREAVAYVQERLDAREVLEALGRDTSKVANAKGGR